MCLNPLFIRAWFQTVADTQPETSRGVTSLNPLFIRAWFQTPLRAPGLRLRALDVGLNPLFIRAWFQTLHLSESAVRTITEGLNPLFIRAWFQTPGPSRGSWDPRSRASGLNPLFIRAWFQTRKWRAQVRDTWRDTQSQSLVHQGLVSDGARGGRGQATEDASKVSIPCSSGLGFRPPLLSRCSGPGQRKDFAETCCFNLIIAARQRFFKARESPIFRRFRLCGNLGRFWGVLRFPQAHTI